MITGQWWYLMLAKYHYKLYIFSFKGNYYRTHPFWMAHSLSLLLSQSTNCRRQLDFCAKCQCQYHWGPHTHKHTLALIAFIVALHCSVDVFKSQFYGFISPQWVRGFAHTRGYLNGSFEIVSVSVRICFRTLSTNRMPGKGTYSHWNWKRFRDLSD